MSKSVLNDIDFGSVYAMFWRMLFSAVNGYDSSPTPELLTLMTINLFHEADYGPTITEVVELTGLEQSSVSRYVAHALKSGLMTETIDPIDRRLRRLRPTVKGRRKAAAHEKEMLNTARLSTEAFRGKGESKNPVQDLKNILLATRGREA